MLKKPTIVILHGWGLSGKAFEPLAAALKKKGYKVFAPDLPGFGKEAAPSYPWKLRDYVRFVEQYLDRHRITKPIFLGHSFGGRVTLKYMQLHPDGSPGIILTGTPGFTPVPRKKLFLFLVIAKIGGFIFSIPPLHLLSDWIRRWFYYAVGARDFFRAEGFMKDTFKNIVQEELVTSMQSIKVPVLLLWGEYDVMVPPVIARQMHEVLPMASLHLIPESDHGVPYKKSEVFMTYVDKFLATL